MTSSHTQPTNYSALYTLISVFFFWGFIAAGNSVFIMYCRSFFDLDQFQSQLVDFAFYGAYYIGALMLYFVSVIRGHDIVGSWGYKRSIVYGLIFSGVGALVMILALRGRTFEGMLMGLFIVALGFSLQQTAANPFSILLGDPATGNSRINLGGAINSLGTMIGPLIVSYALFGSPRAFTSDMIKSLDIDKIILLYVFVGLLFLIASAVFGLSRKVPSGISNEPIESANKALKTLLSITILLIFCFIPVFMSYKSQSALEIVALQEQKKLLSDSDSIDAQAQSAEIDSRIDVIRRPLELKRFLWLSGALLVLIGGLMIAYLLAQRNPSGWGALQYPNLVLGMLAIFIYVGVEVAVGSNIGELLKQPAFGGYDELEIAPFISLYWGSLMIGRWTGAISAFDLRPQTKRWLTILAPILAFGIILLVNTIAGYQVLNFWVYLIAIAIQIGAFYWVRDRPAKSLIVFSGLGTLAMMIGIVSTGHLAVFAFLSAGLCCSIMWPSIFSLAIAHLGKYSAQGSALLIMMILGGAIIPPLQGKMADYLGIHYSFIIPLFCFVYLAYYGFKTRKLF